MKKWILAVAIVGLAALLLSFTFLLGQKSEVGKALDKLDQCKTVEQVKKVFEDNKGKLETINDAEESVIDSAFLASVRRKIANFNLSEKGIDSCKSWLPPPPVSLNLIVVPDLSKRIVDETNNPDQIKRDVALLNHIFKAFENRTMMKMNTKDRLIVDVTDEGQANGLFRTLADNMIVDLSRHRGKINRLYFTDAVRSRYTKSVDDLYALAKDHPLGADYVNYFKRKLPRHIKKPTLFDDYRNALIIITDGYLEAEHILYTGSWSTRKNIANKIKKGNPVEETVLNNIVKIPDIAQKFPTLEVLVLEICERKKRSPQEPGDPGTSEDYEILRTMWADWFKRLEIKYNADEFFILRSDADTLTKGDIDNFLNK